AIDDETEHARPAPPLGHMLAAGSRLRDYEITGLIGEGGFGIVYLAWDHSLQRKVAIKEYMPASMASRVSGSSAIVVKSERHLDTFKAGLRSFVNEARLLARFDHPSLVKVYRFWEENGTAYMVMPFYEGPTLKSALASLGHVPTEDELRAWLKPVLNAVSVLHDGETWHQNIGPDSILLTPVGPVLLGFASAAHAIAASSHLPAAALKPGYAPIEQYGGVAETTRGPWTDLYSLAAVVYGAITGEEPIAAADRLADDRLAPLSTIAAGLYSPRFLAAVDAALAVQPELRPQDHLHFRALMGDIETPTRLELAPPRDLMHEPFAGRDDRPVEVTVPDPPPAPAAVATPAAPAAPTKPAPRRPSPPAAVAAAAAAAAESGPSWMRLRQRTNSFGKRALYGLIAVTCALIGLVALVFSYQDRGERRTASATPPAASSPSTVSNAGPAVAVAASPVVAKAVASIAPSAPVSPVSPPPTLVADRLPNATAATTAARAAAPVTAAAATLAATPGRPPDATTAADRQTRCLDILQKASLEPISQTETDYFKRECK
ncbi:MAG TPA: protein kinase, partial [Caldimonas sp.]|nr:protein kinase [Caldimonas sp.]